MNTFEITFKRVEAFYEVITVKAPTAEEARKKAGALAHDGEIMYDYFKESNLLDEYILSIEKIL
ncbi:MAG: hypothetical protein ABI597_13725 [Gammaproteobacteria bacterium]